MNAEPLITILTPVFNGEKFIAQTIESVLCADINITFEYLVIDDGSTDQTLEILQKYGNTISLFSHKNIGESATVNRGLEMASGRYILVLSADDPLLTGDLINQAVKILEEKDSLVALYPDWQVIDHFGEALKINILPEYSEEIMIGRCRCLPGPGVVFRKDAAIRVGGRRKKWKFVGDYDFWLRLSREGEIQHLPGVLAQWRRSYESTSISQRGLEMANERINLIEDFLLNNKISNLLSRKAQGNAYYLAARLAFFDSRIKGRSLILRGIKLRRGWPEEAKLHVILFLLLLPLSRRVISLFPKLVTRVIDKY
jgi:glycosyltransferase involved in cell wall biosynthesis